MTTKALLSVNKSGKYNGDKGHRELWISVILQAVRDVQSKPTKHTSIQDIRDAHRFLSGSNGALKIIGKYLGINYRAITGTYNRKIKGR